MYMFVLLFLWLFLPQHESIDKRFASSVSEERLKATASELVSFGNRLGGTPSGERSVGYVRQRFRAIGLKTEVVIDPALPIYQHRSWRLRVASPSRLRNLIRNDWLAGFSPAKRITTAPLRYLDPEKRLAELELDSTVVLTDRSVNHSLYQTLERAGALAVLTYAPNIETAYSDWAMIPLLKAADDNPIPAYGISRRNGRKLKTELESGTSVQIQFSASTKIFEGKPKTVIATLPGESEEFFILCAHGDSDSGGPGSDDNASGVAGVLETAHILSEMVKKKVLPEPYYTIKFIIWGSEIHSSESFVRQQGDSLFKIKGVLNFDQIGTGARRYTIYCEPNNSPVNEPLLSVFTEVSERYVGKRGYWKEATTNPALGGSDSYVFLPDRLASLGLPSARIPSVTIFTAAWNHSRIIEQTTGWKSKAWKGPRDSVIIDYSQYYHSSLDIPARTTNQQPFRMSWGVKAAGQMLLRLAWNGHE